MSDKNSGIKKRPAFIEMIQPAVPHSKNLVDLSF
jgi:hypothetical protein